MLIRFTKGKQKPDTLTCVRDDGSRTWTALNFTTHDFGHYAIDATLGWQDAFFGLLAQGWDIADFIRPDPVTGKKPAAPPVALQAEALAGLLDVERRNGSPPPYAAFMELLASVCAGLALQTPELTAHQLAAIRACHADLLSRWVRLPEGKSLELTF